MKVKQSTYYRRIGYGNEKLLLFLYINSKNIRHIFYFKWLTFLVDVLSFYPDCQVVGLGIRLRSQKRTTQKVLQWWQSQTVSKCKKNISFATRGGL